MEYLNFTKVSSNVSIRIDRHLSGCESYLPESYKFFYSYGASNSGNYNWTELKWETSNYLSNEILLNDTHPTVYLIGHIAIFYPINFVMSGGLVIVDGDVMSIACYTDTPKLKRTETRLGETNGYTSDNFKERTVFPYMFYGLFSGCTNILTPPKFSATKICHGGCAKMFKGCTNLTSTPKLSPYVIGDKAYEEMFYGCANLKEIICNAYSYEDESLKNWVTNVNSSGVFYKNNLSSFNSGVNGIPSGWSTKIFPEWNFNEYSTDELAYLRYDMDILNYGYFKRKFDDYNITFETNFANEFTDYVGGFLNYGYTGSYNTVELFLPGMLKSLRILVSGQVDWETIPLKNGLRRLYYKQNNITAASSTGCYTYEIITEDGCFLFKTLNINAI